MDKNISYEGKQVNIGIDVHKLTYAIAVISEGVVVHREIRPASPDDLICFIKRRFGGAHVRTAYEAGFSGFELHRALVEAGIDSIVVNPASIEVSPRKESKNDKRDARRLANQLSIGVLKGIRIPSREEEYKRLISRTREQLVKSQSKFLVQIKMKLHAFGLCPPGARNMGIRLIRHIIAREKTPYELKITIESLLSAYEHFKSEIKKLEKEMGAQAKNDKNEKLYRSIPGVGPVVARVFSNELGDLSQFSSEKKLSSFVGLAPLEHSSGERIHRGNISRQGSARLRGLLDQAAWVAIRKDPFLKEYYDRLKFKRGGKKAIVAVSRKLLCRMLHVFKCQEEYKLAYCC
jgi:transposase